MADNMTKPDTEAAEAVVAGKALRGIFTNASGADIVNAAQAVVTALRAHREAKLNAHIDHTAADYRANGVSDFGV